MHRTDNMRKILLKLARLHVRMEIHRMRIIVAKLSVDRKLDFFLFTLWGKKRNKLLSTIRHQILKQKKNIKIYAN